MSQTPFGRTGPYEEEDYIQFFDRGSAPGLPGSICRVGNDFVIEDGSGQFNPRGDFSGHEGFDTLKHLLAEDSYVELTRDGNGKVTDIIAWSDAGKTLHIREINITRSVGKVSQIVIKQYDGLDAVVQTLTGTVARSGGKVASITWVLT